MSRYDQLDRFACRQHGLVATDQLIYCGWSQAATYRMVKRGQIDRVRRGVYRLRGVPPTWRSSALSAVLTAGEGAVLSHASAAALWGLVDHHGLAGIEITHHAPCRQSGISVHRRTLSRADRTVYDHIPVTTPERTMIDLAARLDVKPLEKLVDEALRRRLISIRRLRSAAARVPVGPSTARMRGTIAAVLATRGLGYEPGANDWERDMDRWFDQSGLPPARRQYRVRVDGHRYKLDRAIPELKVGIEWTGRESHGTRSRFEYDSDRRNRLQAAGWRIVDFHYRSDPALIVRTVLAVCEEQRRVLALGEKQPVGPQRPMAKSSL